VQHQATKLVPCLEKVRYEESLDQFGRTTYEDRRLGGDIPVMIDLFKISSVL